MATITGLGQWGTGWAPWGRGGGVLFPVLPSSEACLWRAPAGQEVKGWHLGGTDPRVPLPQRGSCRGAGGHAAPGARGPAEAKHGRGGAGQRPHLKRRVVVAGQPLYLPHAQPPHAVHHRAHAPPQPTQWVWTCVLLCTKGIVCRHGVRSATGKTSTASSHSTASPVCTFDGSTLGRIRRVPRLGYPGKPAASPQGTAWPRWLDCEAAAAPHPPQHTSTAITSMLP